MKINVGCGYKRIPGFANADIDPDTDADFVTTAGGLYFCEDEGAEEIRLDAVYEHLSRSERFKALWEWMRCLRPGGNLVINWIPDFQCAIKLFLGGEVGPTDEFPTWNLELLERVANGVSDLFDGNPRQLHRGLFTKDFVRTELEDAGFVVDVILDSVYPGERGKPYNICLVAHKP